MNLFVLLTVLFVGLKLTGYINWSWWWVVSPCLIAGVVGGLLGAIAFLAGLFDHGGKPPSSRLRL